MGRKDYLIDTNVAIEYIGEVLPKKTLILLDDIIDKQFYISIINKIELLGFPSITNHEELKFHELIAASNVLDLDENIVTTTIDIRRQYKVKLPDAIIAATAMVNKFIIITRNAKDFDKIKGLNVLNPYNM